MKKILLTGASGNVGYEVLEQLVEKDKYDITVFDVDKGNVRKKFASFEGKIDIKYGDITDEDLVKKIIKDFDVIIHLAAIIPPAADKNPTKAYKVNFEGTKNVVEAIKENGKGFLLFSSSIAVYGDRIENPYIKVTDKLNSGNDYYAELKIKCEELIRKSNIDYSIFRLTAIMNYKPAVDPLMFHMPLDTCMEILTSEDAARAFVNAIEKTDLLNNKTFNLSGGKLCRTTYRDLLKNMFKHYGLNFKYLKAVAFANYNFHCGYLQDGDDLEVLLHHRSENLDDYYRKVRKETKNITRFFTRMISFLIINILQKKSEPLIAKKTHNLKLLSKFCKEYKNYI